ncbi:MAG: DinB family protein [Acidobacteria bacterium]|nr:DinB family protein [Acidobacteriota bacterium]
MTYPEIETFVRNWNYTHQQTSRIVRAAPPDKMEWRPKEGMFTLRELVSHFPQAEQAFIRTAMDGGYKKIDLDLSSRTPEEIANIFDENHEKLAAELLTLTMEQLNREIEFGGHKLRCRDLLKVLVEHEIHHRGQLYTYFHLADVEPPKLYA